MKRSDPWFWNYACWHGRRLQLEELRDGKRKLLPSLTTLLTLSNSDANYLELVETPQVDGSIPQDCPHFRHYLQAPRVLLTIQLQIQGSHKLLVMSDNLLSWLTELRETLKLPVYYKGYKRGCRWTARWRVTQSEIQKCPECRSFHLCETGVHHSPGTRMCAPTWKLSQTLV